MIEFEKLSACDIVAGLSDRRYSSVQVTQYFLDRISSINPSLNAVPFVFEEQALKQARESDRRRAQGKSLSPLDGLPMTIKDALRMKGVPSTYGMLMFKWYRPKGDYELVAELRKSGVVFLGRTAVPTGATDWNCRNMVYPECVNPFDSSKTPGGSSGGAAAALAAGLTPLELGSDVGGSIRYPAHCCGIYGIRTTDGWLPIAKMGPEIIQSVFRRILTSGPMARNLEDLDLMLELFEKTYPLPPQSSEAEASSQNSKLPVTYSTSLLGIHANDSTRKLMNQFLERFSRAGHSIIEKKPDFDFEELYRDWGMIVGYEYSCAIPRLLQNTAFKQAFSWLLMDHRMGPGPMATYTRKGFLAKESEYQEALARREIVLNGVDAYFKENLFWILPVSPISALARAACGKPIETETGPVEYTRYLGTYLIPTTVMGTPGLSVPIGRDYTNMPVGVQIHGARFSDRRMIRYLASGILATSSI